MNAGNLFDLFSVSPETVRHDAEQQTQPENEKNRQHATDEYDLDCDGETSIAFAPIRHAVLLSMRCPLTMTTTEPLVVISTVATSTGGSGGIGSIAGAG